MDIWLGSNLHMDIWLSGRWILTLLGRPLVPAWNTLAKIVDTTSVESTIGRSSVSSSSLVGLGRDLLMDIGLGSNLHMDIWLSGRGILTLLGRPSVPARNSLAKIVDTAPVISTIGGSSISGSSLIRLGRNLLMDIWLGSNFYMDIWLCGR